MFLRFHKFCFEQAAGDGAAGGAAAGGAAAGGDAGKGDAGAGAGAGAGGAAAPAVPSYLKDASAEEIAFAQSKGWDKEGDHSRSMFQSYHNLQKMFGADKAGKTLMLPGDSADEKTLNDFYTKLGRPVAADKYTAPKPEGMSDDLGTSLRDTVFKAGGSDKLYNDLVKWNNETTKKLQTDMTARANSEFEAQKVVLGKEWGAAYEQNVQIAKEAYAKMGWTEDQMNAMQQVLGYDGALKFAHNIGTRISEGKFIEGADGRSGGDPNSLTPEQAKTELKRLEQDPVWKKAWLNKDDPGHKDAMARKARLAAFSVGMKPA